ncbi:hypothetical protein B7486_65630, partial [cyanobacterium TDX16]
MAVAETTAGTSGVPSPAAEFLLPPEAYTDADWLAQEQAGLFHRSWSLVADAAELPEPGARIAVVVGQAPIVVVRTDDGLRAFHNVCRHRGMTVVQPPGTFSGPMGEAVEQASCETLRCPYHGWE